MSGDQPPPERPRSEPEIIPPGQEARVRHGPDGIYIRVDEFDDVRRIHVARPGLPSIILALVIVGIIAAVIFFLLAGVLLVVIPLVLAVIVFALVSVALRQNWRRLQAWWDGTR
jgi:chromate transport protein ChrA